MKNVCLALLLGLLASGCIESSKETQTPANDACKYVGNSATRQYCATTYFQILADPSIYESKRVLLQAWAVNVNGAMILFPTKDSLDGAETVSSIVIVSGSKLEQLNQQIQDGKPRRVTVGGVFKQNVGKGQLGGFDVDRFGSLGEVDRFSLR